MVIRVILIFYFLRFAQSEVLELTCSQIREFVDGHNIRRLQLARGEVPNQPAASEMRLMVWDEELAAKAADWASNNRFAHNPDRTVASRRFTTGENIYYAGNSDMDWQLNIDSALEAWFIEYEDFEFGPLTPGHFRNSDKPIGHYTQMAWWNTVYIGCGISENFEDDMKVYYVVCNYGPPGNYMRQAPYKAEGASDELTCIGDQCDNEYGSEC
ncbi:venom allergen 5-like [Maniola jurtina]|uniref:venom allergen 5-like n=1 Tax=Maniola jurtina TaxID=191418 RepID=UPI001E689F62|nr:venom allergen 5-like [Maniola jurtina]